MVRVTANPAIRLAPISFQREKDVTSHPTPMQSVDLWIQWMPCRIRCWIFVIEFATKPNMESDSLVIFRLEVVQLKVSAAFSQANECDCIRQFEPGSVWASQREI